MPDFVAGLATSITTTALAGQIGAHEAFNVTAKDGRICLDIPNLVDAPLVVAACQDPEIQRFTTVPVPFGPEDAQFFVSDLTRQLWDEGGANWIIREREGQALHFVGTLALRTSKEKAADIGYWTDPAWRGRGIMTMAVRLAVQTALDNLGFECVTWSAHPDNLGSARVAWKNGFSFAGVLRGIGAARDGSREDRLVATFLKGDAFVPSCSWEELRFLAKQ